MIVAMASNLKKQWVRPEVRLLDDTEAEKIRALILAKNHETSKGYSEVRLKRRVG